MSYFEYPTTSPYASISTQVKEISSYLIRLADTLNHSTAAESAEDYIVKMLSSGNVAKNAEEMSRLPNAENEASYAGTFGKMRDLIISTAKVTYESETEPIVQRFESSFGAISEQFGEYQAKIETEITQSAAGLKIASSRIDAVESSFAAGISAANSRIDIVEGNISMLTAKAMYVDIGWVDKASGIWGLDVGQLAETVKIGDTTITNASKFFTRITPNSLQFVHSNNGTDNIMAYLNGSEMYFPSATITGAKIHGGEIKIGNIGNDKYKFTVDENGNLTATEATLTGSIYANGGEIAGFEIAGANLPSNGFWNKSMSTVIETTNDKGKVTDRFAGFLRGGSNLAENNVFIGVKHLGDSLASTSSNWVNNAEYNFYVTYGGSMVANKGKIGIWDFDNSKISGSQTLTMTVPLVNYSISSSITPAEIRFDLTFNKFSESTRLNPVEGLRTRRVLCNWWDDGEETTSDILNIPTSNGNIAIGSSSFKGVLDTDGKTYKGGRVVLRAEETKGIYHQIGDENIFTIKSDELTLHKLTYINDALEVSSWVNIADHITITKNARYLYGTASDGVEYPLIGMSSSNNVALGGSDDPLPGNVNIYAKGKLRLNGTNVALSSDIPSKVSALTNDSGYLTAHQSLSAYLKSSDAASTYLKSTDAASTYLKLSGGTLSGNVILNNAKYLQGKDTSGTAHSLIGITSNNNVNVGNATITGHLTLNVGGKTIQINSNGNIYVGDTTNTANVYLRTKKGGKVYIINGSTTKEVATVS